MGTQSKTQTQKAEPWGPSTGYRQNIMSDAASWYNSTKGPIAPTREQFTTTNPGTWVNQYQGNGTGMVNSGRTYVPGSTSFDSAGYNAAMGRYNQAKATYVDPVKQAMLRYQGALQDTPLENNAYGLTNDIIQGKYLEGNPYLDTMIGNTLANVNSQFSGAGRYGSGAHSGYLANAANQLRYQNYDAERGRQMQALGLAPSVSQLRYSPYQQNVAVSQAIENLPLDRLSRYSDVINSASGNYGQQSGQIYQNQLAQLMGLGLMGAGIYSGFGLGGTAAGGGALVPFSNQG